MQRPHFCKCEDWPCCECGEEASQESQHEAWLERQEDMRDADDMDGERFDDEDDGDNMTDAEADADTLRSAGFGTDEDYGSFGGGFYDE